MVSVVQGPIRDYPKPPMCCIKNHDSHRKTESESLTNCNMQNIIEK